jgi:hypothetical protein
MYTVARNDVYARREKIKAIADGPPGMNRNVEPKLKSDEAIPVALASNTSEVHLQTALPALRRRAVAPYLNFLTKLNLLPDDRAKVIKFLMEKDLTDQEIDAALIDHGYKRKTTAYIDAFSILTQEFSGELENLLGPMNYNKLLQWPAYDAFRQGLDTNIAIDFKEAGLPLDDTQLDQIAWLFVEKLGSVYEDRHAERDRADFLSKPEHELLSTLSQTLDARRLDIVRTGLQEKNLVYDVLKRYPNIDRRF